MDEKENDSRKTVNFSMNDDPPTRSTSVNNQPVVRRFKKNRSAKQAVKKARFTNGRYIGSVRINRGIDGSLRHSNANAVENRRKESLRRRRMLLRVTSGDYHNVPIEGRDFNSNIRKTVLSELRGVGEEELPDGAEEDPNIDGGWAWVVMMVSFTLFMVVSGVAYSFGILYDDIHHYFHVSGAEVSLVTSMQKAFLIGMSPIASVLVERFGCRVMGVTGSLTACLSFVAVSFAPKTNGIALVIVAYGVIGGFGLSLMYMTAVVGTSLYFEKKRPLGVGIAACGSGVGIAIFPVITESLLKALLWQNCVRVQAGFMFVGVIISVAYRPIKQKAATKDQEAHTRTMREHLASLVNWHMFWEPVFILMVFGAFISTLGIAQPFIYLIGLADKEGINHTDTLVSIMGITYTTGKVLASVGIYNGLLNPLVVVSIICLIGGVATVMCYLYKHYALFAVYSAFHGLVYAMDSALSSEILSRTLGAESLSGAFGILSTCRGLALAIPIGGALKDVTGYYDVVFYLAGACILVNSVIIFMGYIILRIRGEALDDSFEYEELQNGEKGDEMFDDIQEEPKGINVNRAYEYDEGS